MLKFQVPLGRKYRTDIKCHSAAEVTWMSSQTEVIDSKHLPLIVLLYACSTGSHCTLNEANTTFHTYYTAFFSRRNIILASYKNIIQPFAHSSMFGPKTAEDDFTWRTSCIRVVIHLRYLPADCNMLGQRLAERDIRTRYCPKCYWYPDLLRQ